MGNYSDTPHEFRADSFLGFVEPVSAEISDRGESTPAGLTTQKMPVTQNASAVQNVVDAATVALTADADADTCANAYAYAYADLCADTALRLLSIQSPFSLQSYIHH